VNKHLYLCHQLVLSSPTLMMHGHTNLKNDFHISGSSCETHYELSDKTQTQLLFRRDVTQRMIKRHAFRYTWSRYMWPRGSWTSEMEIAPFLPSHSATPVLTLTTAFSADYSHCRYF